MKKNISRNIWRVFAVTYFTVCFSICFTTPVYAYIDPATTAMITQIVAGIFISAGVAFGMFRQKIILFFKNVSVKRIQRKIEKQNRKAK